MNDLELLCRRLNENYGFSFVWNSAAGIAIHAASWPRVAVFPDGWIAVYEPRSFDVMAEKDWDDPAALSALSALAPGKKD